MFVLPLKNKMPLASDLDAGSYSLISVCGLHPYVDWIWGSNLCSGDCSAHTGLPAADFIGTGVSSGCPGIR
jgi:hypothetical protein